MTPKTPKTDALRALAKLQEAARSGKLPREVTENIDTVVAAYHEDRLFVLPARAEFGDDGLVRDVVTRLLNTPLPPDFPEARRARVAAVRASAFETLTGAGHASQEVRRSVTEVDRALRCLASTSAERLRLLHSEGKPPPMGGGFGSIDQALRDLPIMASILGGLVDGALAQAHATLPEED